MTTQDDQAKRRELLGEIVDSFEQVYSDLSDRDGFDTALERVNRHIDTYLATEREKTLGNMPLYCTNCGRHTFFLEAELRNFNTGRCAMCNGSLAASFDSIAELQRTGELLKPSPQSQEEYFEAELQRRKENT